MITWLLLSIVNFINFITSKKKYSYIFCCLSCNLYTGSITQCSLQVPCLVFPSWKRQLEVLMIVFEYRKIQNEKRLKIHKRLEFQTRGWVPINKWILRIINKRFTPIEYITVRWTSAYPVWGAACIILLREQVCVRFFRFRKCRGVSHKNSSAPRERETGSAFPEGVNRRRQGKIGEREREREKHEKQKQTQTPFKKSNNRNRIS